MAETGVRRWVASRLRPIRGRITLAATLVTGLALAGSGWLMIRSIEGTQLAQIRTQADAELDDLADQLAEGASQLQMDLDSKLDILGLVDENGVLRPPVAITPSSDLAGSRQVILGRLPPSSVRGIPFDASPSTDEGVVQFRTRFLDDDGRFEIVERTVETPTGEQTLIASLPTDEVSRSIEAVRGVLLLAVPALVCLVGLSTWWLVGRALRPVEAIRAEAASIGGKTVYRRVSEPPTDDEIGRLARTMNAMLDRLDRSARKQRQFVSDASHELRSPVTAIRAGLEVALHEGDRADWPAVAHDLLAEESQLERLLGDLLILAADDELDAAAADEEATPAPAADRTVDLAELAVDEAGRSRGVLVTAATPGEPVLVEGSRSHLTRLVSNLLDNAARHARSRVDVSLGVVAPPESANPRLRLLVDDDGPGIPEADRQRVFERFVRLDEARSRDDGGAGLGLAVVRSVARRHGGDARAASAPLGGARLVVELPAQSPPESS